MNDLLDFESLKVTIASPGQVKAWSFGEVTKPETINYRTLKPEKDGLFAENIFGPTKDYECYCGKYKRIRYRGVICDKCGVEVTQSKVRRERLGHITLAAPVAHNWFVKGAPSKLSLVLDLSLKSLEAVIYFASYLVIEVDDQGRTQSLSKLEADLEAKKKQASDNIDKGIAALQSDLRRQLVELKGKGSENQEIAAADLELKSKQEIQKLRDNLAVEHSQLEQIFKAVSDLTKSISFLRVLSEDEYLKLEEYGVADFLKVGMGAEGLLEVLKKIDLNKLSAELREEVRKTSGQRHIKATKRLRVIEGMRIASISPEWMIMQILPVIPPDLRPMVQLPGGRFATSDLNDLYRRVINRNNRLKRLIDLGAPEIILRNEKRMLQEAVDALIDSNLKTTRRGAGGGHVLRSLSDMLRGKQGRFRQNLLGKRVDYSGRSVIVVGPQLKLNQVGLPKEMALEMFKPFVLREVIARGLAANIKGAKNVLEIRSSEVWDILEEVIFGHPVLINRAPTLHRLGIQAFFPVLIDGSAIQIHPSICAGFGADFDGDQMAVHVPLSKKSQEEAVRLMMAKENILKPASGQPVIGHNREMALGIYYATSVDETIMPIEDRVFIPDEAVLAFQIGKIKLRQQIKVHLKGEVTETVVGRILLNRLLPESMRFINKTIGAKEAQSIVMDAFNKLEREEAAKLIDDLKDFGFWGVTISGVSVAVFDNTIIKEKDKMIKDGDKEVAEIESNFKKGLITNEERKILTEEVWTRIGDEIARKTLGSLDANNPVSVIMKSGGARATTEQIKQLSGMRGFSVDPTGKIVELPTKSNYRQGFAVFEYFTSCRGARKGVADKALKTADAGYLTRRLVDVAHEAIIRAEGCSDKEGVSLPVPTSLPAVLSRFVGRKLSAKVVDPKSKKVLASEGEFVDEEILKNIVEARIENISIFSSLTCKTKFGLCAKCYGWDLTTRKVVQIGVPVGVVAAQSIGEPGTQLTMRTFHTGGVVGVDITMGLPRVEELFEARTPKSVSPLSEISGKVSVIEGDMGTKIRIRTTIKPYEEREYAISATATVLVEDGQLIAAGTQLASGHLDIKEVVRVNGLKAAQRYIVDQAREVYASQGVQINDKHFEVIVRKMSDKVRVETQGDTNLLPGEIIDRVRFEEENQRVLAAGGDPATASAIILGITRASLLTESFLSAASFQETTTVLADAAASGKVDRLLGLKENVIIGRLIPTDPSRVKVR
ncbi:MAG: DNA-directed RNA polymerase [Candidatus Daviesbacteria bacterium GW2011_GWA1_41_61]|uniref:DNA-directed RNA polymerase subunit beta' n=1 Tax=Candidatus Daviesbacteria bacterium GW2011_GWA2_40_9 TaxID=1618424 RepID=A0A0G0U2K7_9BACT|nr:MAG: DNA-directed RNA polymerase subunit beta', DNA-directed RNA polymerase subunit beta' [Candidatus Daviesbacteria bacterium GW2011_GWC1_40_9]KKR83329.1 MAG: DNA-directed RNA polymerase [Candidatus Daviesbacteria bacterium GW2011_GWA2_40_9]KKR93240.1 MAG: DNA-directed RNA polymerase [Candidatus Daviesbacteria bacterium GW2011_GWB1_41_15]KKS14728.1 MAG: DNA-directed RNA polymerase [Candidatus Daviesbacteria bacterium GW2011_GWA1_41_61]